MDPNAQQFAAALWPDAYRAFGRRLQPFCLGHALLLHRLGIDPLGEDFCQRSGDVLTAAYILAQWGDQAAAAVESRWLGWWLGWARARYPGAKFERHAITVQVAIVRGYSGPGYSTRENTRQARCGMPADGSMLEGLMARYGYTLAQALATPRQLAWWLHLARLEADGLIRIEDDGDRDHRARVEAAKANPEATLAEMRAMIEEQNVYRKLAGQPPIPTDNLRML